MPDSTWPGIEDFPARSHPVARRVADVRALRPEEARHDASWPAADQEAHRGAAQDRPIETVAELDSFVAGLAACAAPWTVAALRAGAELSLRRRDHADYLPGAADVAMPEVQVWTAEGQPLGRLPPEDAAVLDRLAVPGRPVRAHVSAVVPAFLRPRVQVRIAFAEAPGAAAAR